MRSLRLPLPFDEEICCLAVFLCETGDSGPNPCLDGRAKSREIIAGSRTNHGRNFSHESELRSGLVLGLSPIQMKDYDRASGRTWSDVLKETRASMGTRPAKLHTSRT